MFVVMWILVYLFVGFWVTQLYLVPEILQGDGEVDAGLCLCCQFFWPLMAVAVFVYITWPDRLQKSISKMFGKIGDQIVALYTICSKSFDK